MTTSPVGNINRVSRVDNISFDNGTSILDTDGQVWIGNSAGNPGPATLTQPAAGITITGGANSITFALANDLSAVEGIATTGVASRTAADTWATSSITQNAVIVGAAGELLSNIGPLTDGQLPIGSTGNPPVAASLTQPAAGITITGGAGSITFALANDLAAVEGLAGTGLSSRTAADTWTTSSVTQNAILYGGAGQTVSNLGPLTDGQLVIGSSGLAPNAATLATGTGITVTNGAGVITIAAADAAEGTGQTIGAVTDDLVTVALGVTAGNYIFKAYITGFESTGPGGAFIELTGGGRTTGAASTKVSTTVKNIGSDAALVGVTADYVANVNSIIVRVTGVAGLTINWNAKVTYAFVS